jgi:hypothetical protein
MTRLWTRWGMKVLLPAGARYFCVHHRAQAGSGATESPIRWLPGTVFPGVKCQGRETHRTHPSNPECKNTWSYTATSLYVFTVWCLIKHRTLHLQLRRGHRGQLEWSVRRGLMFESRLRHRCLCALFDLFRCRHLIDGNGCGNRGLVSGTTLHGVITERLHNIAVHIACARLKLVVISAGGGISHRAARPQHHSGRSTHAHTVCPSGRAA